MQVEHEAKVLEIDPPEVTRLILTAGGRSLGERLMRRYVYDVVPGDSSVWLRLRDTSEAVTLTVKQITSDRIDGTSEVEVVVDDFERTSALLSALGFTPKSYQENRRASFTLDGAQLEIDTWPRIPPYLEIEADSMARVIETARRLGYAEDDLTGENTMKVYTRYGIDLSTIRELRF